MNKYLYNPVLIELIDQIGPRYHPEQGRPHPMKLLLTAAVASAGVLFSGGSVRAQDPRLAAAIPSIEAAIEKSGADVAVAFRTLDGRSSWFLRADEPFHAASTMKVPVLIELYHQAHQGKLRLEDTLV